MINSENSEDLCTIVVAELFARINAQRKLIKRTPIEERAMASRCTLRYNINRQNKVDFSAEKIAILRQDLEGLEKLINNQFGVYFEGELRKLCAKPKKPVLESFSYQEPLKIQPQKSGFFFSLKRLFGSK